MEGLQTTAAESSFAADQQFHLVANSVAKLLETARRELGRDQEAAKASLVTASHILQAEIERCSGANGATRGGPPAVEPNVFNRCARPDSRLFSKGDESVALLRWG